MGTRFSSKMEESCWNEDPLLPWRSEQILKKRKVWNRHDKNIRLTARDNLYNAYVRIDDVTQELAPVEPTGESWTRMEVDDGQRDKQI